jgi:hypothetical protein
VTWVNRLSLFQVIVIHLLLLFGMYALLFFLGLVKMLPTEISILQWDANWYKSIAHHNYWYSTTEQSNSGFFPLFPLLWKCLNTGAIGISLFNWVIGLAGILMLAKTFTISNKTILLFLSFPSLFFIYVPYAESLFLVFGALLLFGIKKNKPHYVVIGSFLAACTKATAIFFIPSFAIMLLFSQPLSQFNVLKSIWSFSLFSLSVCLGIATVVLLQYMQTGIWLAYFKTQSSLWGRAFNVPVFPLTTWDASRLLSLDAFAFIIGVAAFAFLISQCFRIINSYRFKILSYDTSYWFSVGFLVMVLFSILFFNPIDAATQTTSILSINRYMIVSPFLLIMLHNHTDTAELTAKQLVGLSLFVLFILLSFKWDWKPNTIGVFLGLGVYIIGYVLIVKEARFMNLSWVFYLVNSFLQLLLFDSFLSAYWVG